MRHPEGKRPWGPHRQRPQLVPILIPEILFIAEIEGPVIPDGPTDPGKGGSEGDSDGLSIVIVFVVCDYFTR